MAGRAGALQHSRGRALLLQSLLEFLFVCLAKEDVVSSQHRAQISFAGCGHELRTHAPRRYRSHLDARRASYDAALTLQPTQPFTISQVDTGTTILTGPWDFPAKPAVTRFDDAKGYYAGLFAGPPCNDGSFCFANEGGSAVIPAFGAYTTRITHYDGTPYESFYGTLYQGSILGSGNPGDDGLQFGVRINLLSKSANGTTAKLSINGPPTP